MPISSGYTFRRAIEHDQVDRYRHLWVILTDPGDEEPSNVVIVNLTTHTDRGDQTVILDEGDHPFIQRRTIINYVDAKFSSTSAINKAIEIEAIVPHQPFQSEILEKIKGGLLQSPDTPNNIKDYCRKQWEIGD